MNISTHLGRLLAIFLIVGLVLAPLSAPANAAMVASTATADMPCCPDKSAPMDCDQCPLMAICLVKTFQQPSATGVVEIRPVTVRMLMPQIGRAHV